MQGSTGMFNFGQLAALTMIFVQDDKMEAELVRPLIGKVLLNAMGEARSARQAGSEGRTSGRT
jgi:hypothetical protein